MKQSTEAHRVYMRSRYHTLRNEFIVRLGGMCKLCGAVDNLEFDHIDPQTKVESISKLWSHAKEIIEAELAKCQLLCKSCHLSKSLATLPKLEHGTVGMYERHKCRCDVCRRFYAQYRQKYRPANKRGRRPRWNFTGE